MKTQNDLLLSLIRQRKTKNTQWRYGITTADSYVKTLQECIGSDKCYRLMSRGNVGLDDLLQKASNTLVYSNPDMDFGEMTFKSTEGSFPGLELPKNTLIAFRHVLTSSRKDRDGDVLHSDGASVDPKMLLLWQHVHTMPIGKAIQVVDQNPNRLVMVSAIVDMNELCHDAAVMVDNGMGRFSHGFQATEFKEIKEGSGMSSGFDVKRFEILEESLVSVPANPDAETQEVILDLVEGGKLKSAMMREMGKTIRSKRNVTVPGVEIKYRERDGEKEKEIICSSFDQLKAAVDAGLVGEKKDENQPRDGSEEDGRGEKASDAGTSEKADAEPGEESEPEESGNKEMTCAKCGYKGPPNEKGMCPKCGAPMMIAKSFRMSKKAVEIVASPLFPYGGYIDGSFEAVSGSLREITKTFLNANGISTGEKDWVGVVGTFPKYAVVFVEREAGGRRDFYKVPWEMKGNQPALVGEPAPVEVVFSMEFKEKSMGQMNKLMVPAFGKPYPNEHAARMNDPGKYAKIRRQNDKFGEGIHAIWGVDEEGKTELQAIRFDSSKFTPEEAKKWLEDHDLKPSTFESAKKEEKSVDTDEKSGRVLSKTNEGKIKRAKEHVDDVAGWTELPRSHGAQLREASSHLGDVLTSVQVPESGESTSKPTSLTLQIAMSHVLTHADPQERKKMIGCLQALENAEITEDLVNQLSHLL